MGYYKLVIQAGEPVVFVKSRDANAQTYTMHLILLLICLHVARKHGMLM